jgi:hypothetical protein
VSTLKVIQIRSETNLLLKFEGKVDEDATFPQVDVSNVKIVEVDLEGVSMMNSYGTRDWAQWIRGFPKSIHFRFVKCPRVFIDQANMFDGLFPSNFSVHSFQVPYFCDSCKKTSSALLTIGREVSASHVGFPEAVPCDTCQGRADLDIIETVYFKFLENIKDLK